MICRVCNNDLTEESFPKTGKGYLSHRCKICTAEYKKQWKIDNADHVVQQNKEWRLKNIEHIAKIERDWYENIGKYRRAEEKAKRIRKPKLSIEELTDRKKKNIERWKVNNREKRRNYYKDRYSNNPQARLRTLIRSRIRKLLKRQAVRKNNKTSYLLGCVWIELVKYIEMKFYPNEHGQYMNWSNHGMEWELDHIKPLHTFDLTDPVQQEIAFNYRNLQPLWIKDHKNKTKNDIKHRSRG